MKSSTMPEPSGPGRYSASTAMMSSKRSGASFLTSFFMPSDSTWKMAVVLPSLRIW
jgi:hypothetical protein